MINILHVNSQPQENLSTNTHFIQSVSKKVDSPVVEEWCGCSYMRPVCSKNMPAIVGIDYVSVLLQTISDADTATIEVLNIDTNEAYAFEASFINSDNTLFGGKFIFEEIGDFQVHVTANIQGSEIEYYSGIFNVMPNEPEYKEGTIVIETSDTGYSAKSGIDYRTIGKSWMRMIRAYGGYDLAPHEIERTVYIDANRKHTQIFDSSRRKFSAWVLCTIEQSRIFETQILGSEAFISRHEAGKMDYEIKIAVVIDSIDEIKEFAPDGTLMIRFTCSAKEKNNTKSLKY